MRALGIFPVYRLLALFWFKWAAREMGPLHPDLPYVMHRINNLERGRA